LPKGQGSSKPALAAGNEHRPNRARHWWAIASVIFISAMLRPAVSGVGPLLGEISHSLKLAPAQTSLLASLPVLCFGLGAFLGPYISGKLGLARAFTWMLVLLTIGIAIRPWFGYNALLTISVLVTLGIAVSNVLFPAMIRVEFPGKVARMTAVYTTLLAVFAAAAAVFAVPLDSALNGWRGSLAAWALPGVLAVVTWLMTAKQVEQAHPSLNQVAAGGDRHVWLHPVTWSLVGFFGLQSMNFYCMLNWLPSILETKGFTQAEAGNLLGLVTIVGVPAGLLITANLAKFKSLPVVAVLISLVTAAGVFLMFGGAAVTVIGGLIAGLGLACSFPLSLALIALKAHDQKQTTLLSAVSQGFGYLIAALGTFAMGYSFSLTGGWGVGLAIVGGAGLIQAAIGWYAAGKHTL